MTRSHAHRATVVVVASGVLALGGCGNASQENTAAGPGGSAAPAPTSPSATPTATASATANGIDDPKTGLEGTQPEGNCAWATKEQLGDLLPGSVNGPLRGVINQQPLSGYPGTLRICLVGLGDGASMSIGIMRFDSADALDEFLADTKDEPGTRPVEGVPGGTYTVTKTPMLVAQSFGVAEGSSVRFLTYRSPKDTARIEAGEPVATPDRLEQLQSAHTATFR